MRGSRRNGKAKQQGVEHSFFITNTPLKDLVQPEGRGGGPAQGALKGGTTAREGGSAAKPVRLGEATRVVVSELSSGSCGGQNPSVLPLRQHRPPSFNYKLSEHFLFKLV